MEPQAYIKQNNLIGIKAGAERPDFLDIWMVVVRDRIFARSWGLAERSWYNSFLKNPQGEILCGTQRYRITARIPSDLADLNDEISKAYLEKYNHGRNAPYAQGIVQAQHVARTMEFVPVSKDDILSQ